MFYIKQPVQTNMWRYYFQICCSICLHGTVKVGQHLMIEMSHATMLMLSCQISWEYIHADVHVK